MTTESPSKLIAKLAEVMGTVKRMPKDEKNQQGWTYTSVMDMLDHVRPEMAKRGLLLVPDVESCDWQEGQTANGKAMTTCHMTVRWTVYESETGASISFRTVGEAFDTSDKATNKAMTAAQKLAVSKLVMMSTGESDEDADAAHVERVARADAPRRDEPAPHGICPDHGVPYFQSGKMRSPAHKLDAGGWCNKPDAPPPDDGGWNAPPPADAPPAKLPDPKAAAQAAASAGFGAPKMPASHVAAPHGICELHQKPWSKTAKGQFGHYFTPNPPRGDGKGEWCPRRTPAPSLADQAAQVAAERAEETQAEYREV